MRKNPKNWGSLTNDPAKSFSWDPHGWVSCFPWISRKLFPYTFSSGVNSLSSCWLSRFHPMELGSICVVFRSAIDGFLHASTFLIFSSPTFTISEDFLSHGHSTPAKCWPQISGPDQAMLPPILCWKPKPPPEPEAPPAPLPPVPEPDVKDGSVWTASPWCLKMMLRFSDI